MKISEYDIHTTPGFFHIEKITSLTEEQLDKIEEVITKKLYQVEAAVIFVNGFLSVGFTKNLLLNKEERILVSKEINQIIKS